MTSIRTIRTRWRSAAFLFIGFAYTTIGYGQGPSTRFCDPQSRGDCIPDTLEVRFPSQGGASLFEFLDFVPGAVVSTQVVTETASSLVQGFSYAVRHDSRFLSLVAGSVTTIGTVLDPTSGSGLDPDFNVTTAVDGGYVSFVVLSYTSLDSLPSGRNVIAKAEYVLTDNPGSAGTLVEIVSGELASDGAPPVAVNFAVDGKSRFPTTLVAGRVRQAEFADCNENGRPDTSDISEGTSADCNQNNVPDECDLASGRSADGNQNRIPDECEGIASLALTHNVRLPICEVADVKVLLTNDCAVEGVSFGVGHDPSVLEALDFVPAAVWSGKVPEFLAVNLDADASECLALHAGPAAGVTVGMIGSTQDPRSAMIPPGSRREIATLRYRPAAGSSMEEQTAVDFVECLIPAPNSPPVNCSITCNQKPVFPLAKSGTTVTLVRGSCFFKRGFCNSDQRSDISDAVAILSYLFSGGLTPTCLKACDIDDNGLVNVGDGIRLLDFLFRGGPAPMPPFPSCGLDPTADDLDCERNTQCP
jgi:hypothetical protein